MSKSATTRLAAVLDAERTALLSGDLAALEALAEEKLALAEDLEATPRQLAPLAETLKRNEALLDAARQGVGDVLAMLRKQRDARTRLSSYDSKGQATQIASGPAVTERRF